MTEHLKQSVLKMSLCLFVLLAGCNTDLYSKKLARDTLEGEQPLSLVSGYLDLRYTENESASFSFLSTVDKEVRTPLLAGLQVTASVLLLGLIIYHRRKTFGDLLPLLLILGGALGNAIDRVRLGHVVDFIHFHIGELFSWPIFNFADIWIAVGLGLLILQLARGRSLLTVTP